VPRKGHVPKREILPDPVYKDKVVAKLINNIMLDGKKGVAQRICYDAFDIVKTKTGKDPLEVFKQALENIMPALEVKAERVTTGNGKRCYRHSLCQFRICDLQYVQRTAQSYI
jgi:small subunit ribosomal protein S7